MDEDPAMLPHPTRPEAVSLRRDTRDEVFLRTTLSNGRKTGISGQLVNISTSGFMVRTLETFAAEHALRIHLPLVGDVPGRVVWALGGRVGCAFEAPFDDKIYHRLLGAIRAARPNWAQS